MTELGVLGDGGTEIMQDLKSDAYNRYIIFTYSISTELCSWFDDDDEVVICGPDDVVEAVRDTELSTEASVQAEILRSHAKIYLMWGEEEIQCWIGSCNFTYAGLHDNIEWVASFNGSVNQSFSPTELLNGNAGKDLTENWPIKQVLELTASALTGGDTGEADSLLLDRNYPYVLLHSHRSNTLKRALKEKLQDADGEVSITYYSPYVNYPGVKLFAETLSPTVSRDALALTVRTCRLHEINGAEMGLSPDNVKALRSDFSEFDYLVRSPGDQGSQLRSGRELRSGRTHHKTILISYTDATGEKRQLTLLTSANLTRNAWQHDSGNFEVGLLIREEALNERLSELFGPDLGHCFEHPREHELEEATKKSKESTPFTEVWIDDLLKERLEFSTSKVSIRWDDTLPHIESVQADIHYRNVLSGDRTTDTVDLEPSEDGFTSSITPVTNEPNTVIDFVRIKTETAFKPPERRLTDVGINRLLNGELDLDKHPYDTVIWDGECYDRKGDPPARGPDPKEVWLRDNLIEPRSVRIVHHPRPQPHLNDEFIISVETGSLSCSKTGDLLYLDVTVDPAITVCHDQLAIRTESGTILEYIAIDQIAENAIRYYFDTEYASSTAVISIVPPLDRYYPPYDRPIKLPDSDSQTNSSVRHFCSSELTAEPAIDGEQEIVDDETPIQFVPPTDLQDADIDLDVTWGIRGFDRFGSRQSISEPLSSQEPHRQIWFRGLADLSTDSHDLSLLTRRNSTTILEQPFSSNLTIQRDVLPTALDIDSLSNHSLIAWIVFERTSLLKKTVRETERPLSVSVHESGDEYERIMYDVLDEGGLVCLPILGSHVSETVRFNIDLKLHGDRPEIPYYAPGRRTFDIEVRVGEGSKSIQLHWDDSTHSIRHQSGAPEPTLAAFNHRIDIGELAGMFFKTDPFGLPNHRSLAVKVKRPSVLHLVSK